MKSDEKVKHDYYDKLYEKGLDQPRQQYGQDWSAYDNAKTNEDILFKKLLTELLTTYINEKTQTGRGRRKTPRKEKIFAMCIKIYYRSDLRKTVSILKELKKLNYISTVPCYKSLDNFFNETELSKVLDDLIFITSLPLSQLEKTGAIDATGFAISRFARWFDYKWGEKKEKKERVWRKAHAMIGCTSNTVLSIKVTKGHKADSTMFEEVVGNKTKWFNMEDFVADKAYNSRDIYEFLHKINLNPIIPFKKNVSGKARGSMLWAKMFKYFNDNYQEFMDRYHQRSNVETSFHMVKQRFGDNLKTKSFEANVNEIKVKFLCHNLCVLIQEIFERKIEVDFESCVKKAILCKN
jgi:transposase